MVWYFAAVLCMTVITSALPESDSTGFSSSDIPAYQLENGTIITENLSSPIIRPLTFDKSKVQFYLYRLENSENPQKLITSDFESLQNSGFDPNCQTKIVIHGFQGGFRKEFAQLIKDAYLRSAKQNYNIILVDYEFYNQPYLSLVGNAAAIGGCVKSLIIFLIDHYGLDPNSVHVIGHSMGAHIAGFAAEGLNMLKITGLDPAGPIIGMYGPNKRLDSQDAQCVDIWHTSHELGIKYDLGDMDFYPNGGDNQPSCDEADFTAILTGGCDHIASFQYFAYTIVNPFAFPAIKCGSYEQALAKNCAGATITYMSEALDATSPKGVFYVPSTNLGM